VRTSRPVSAVAVRTVASELFAAQGYRGTSMKDIAGALGVTAGNLYNHVPSKQHLLFAIMDNAMERAHAALERALAGVDAVSTQLRLATETLVLDFLEHPAEITVCNTEIRSLEEPNRSIIIGKRDGYAARIRALVDRGCAEGHFFVSEPRVAAFAVLELGNNAKAWFNERGELSAEEVAKMYGEFALHIVGDGYVHN
jgi:AcrR family transcriptional regulator